MHFPRVMIAGTHSGTGKTVISLGLMTVLRKLGLQVQPFKVGPDYIDAGLHFYAAGRVSHNLDGWMGSEETVATVFSTHAARADIAVIEGVMGLFDGAKGRGVQGSSADIARILRVPILLVVDVRGMAQSCVALIKGYCEYDPCCSIAGVILNHASDFHRNYIKTVIEKELGIPVLACLPSSVAVPPLPSTLLSTNKQADIQSSIQAMAVLLEQNLDIATLLKIAREASELTFPVHPKVVLEPVRIGIARDEAFCFYYQDSLDYLQELGAELFFFSPLHDRYLPEVDGLYLGGGFQEAFLPALSANKAMYSALRQVHKQGMPIYAEAGAAMYLCQTIDTAQHQWSGVGLVPLHCQVEKHRVGMGYVEAVACHHSILARVGDKLRGHEFHYLTLSQVSSPYSAYVLTGGRGVDFRNEGYSQGHLLASCVQLHLRSNPRAARYFIEVCQEFGRNR
ncbi:MAG TPA: cobyrinate a,c-diamide synthase [Syntrophomonadaceae bacterium]|nr:cobyrinate a,c-diamide synthase [Syntrophomonadaceae bacterium]